MGNLVAKNPLTNREKFSQQVEELKQKFLIERKKPKFEYNKGVSES